MTLALAPDQILIDETTGTSGSNKPLTICDSNGNAVEFARVIIYDKVDYDGATYTELGATETDGSGWWLEAIALPGYFAGRQLYLRAYRSAGYRVKTDGKRRWYPEWGPQVHEFTAPRPHLEDEAGVDITDTDGSLIYLALSPGAHPMAVLDSDGNAITLDTGEQLLMPATIGP